MTFRLYINHVDLRINLRTKYKQAIRGRFESTEEREELFENNDIRIKRGHVLNQVSKYL